MSDFTTLRQLFEERLGEAYDAEKQLLQALPEVVEAVSDQRLREAFSANLAETHEHVGRLEEVFALLDLRPRRRWCAGMTGLLEEVGNLLDAEGSELVRDAALIAEYQRVEHYEMASYSALISWAKLLQLEDALDLLMANDREDKTADASLMLLARSAIDFAALGASTLTVVESVSS